MYQANTFYRTRYIQEEDEQTVYSRQTHFVITQHIQEEEEEEGEEEEEEEEKEKKKKKKKKKKNSKRLQVINRYFTCACM